MAPRPSASLLAVCVAACAFDALGPAATPVVETSADECGFTQGGPTTAVTNGSTWTLQFGGVLSETPTAIARAPDGSYFVTGDSRDGLRSVAFLAKITPDGAFAWCRQVAPPDDTGRVAWNAAVAGSDGSVFVVGETDRAIAPGADERNEDLLVAHYAGDGTRLWIRQDDFGTPDVPARESGRAAALDAGGHLIASGTTNGSVQGVSSRVSGSDVALFVRIAADGKNAAALAVADARASAASHAVLAFEGRVLGGVWSPSRMTGGEAVAEGWITVMDVTNFASPHVFAEVRVGGPGEVSGSSSGPEAMAAVRTSVVVGGNVSTSLLDTSVGGGTDGFAVLFSDSGDVTWSRRFGTPEFDGVTGVTPCGSDTCVVGTTLGALATDSRQAGGGDAFVARIGGEQGAVRTVVQFGTESAELVQGVTSDGGTGVVVVGRTEGSLGRNHRGNGDVFVRRLVP